MLKIDERLIQHNRSVVAHHQMPGLGRSTQAGKPPTKPDRLESGLNTLAVPCPDLKDNTQLLGEGRGQWCVIKQREVDRNAGTPGEGHFRQRRQQAAIRDIVQCLNPPLGEQRLNRVKALGKDARVIKIWGRVTQLAIDLREGGTTESAPATQIQ
jgi:hypothetical protein